MDLKPMQFPVVIAIAVLSVTIKLNAAEPVKHANAPAPKQQPDLRGTKKAPLVVTVADAPDPRGTEKSPLVVTVAPGADADSERAAAKEEQRLKAGNEARIVRATDVIAVGTWVLALATILLWAYTYRLWKTSSEAARASDKAAGEQLAQVTKSATAMESVAVSTAQNSQLMPQLLQKQARAYVAVLVGGATYQERPKGLRFDAVSVVRNSGFTPGRRLRHRARAAIVPHPLPADFEFALPGGEPEGGPILNPREDYTFRTLVDDFVPDDDVQIIKSANGGRALYIWGEVSYDDAFGETHVTKFCHFYIWWGTTKDGEPGVQGFYERRHNDAT